ncbi:MAG: YicC family protein [Verrucomicrobiales bacterium]|nr:YicC family protein [Verrucomicrobiales bacterium]
MRSMTGFGRGDATSGNWTVTVELSGVNRKQVDISVNLPNRLSELEPETRKLLGAAISRGRINARILLDHGGIGDTRLEVDEALAAEYVAAAKKLLSEEVEICPADLYRAPGVFKIEDITPEPEELRDPLHEALAGALDELSTMQEKEGANLREDLEARIDTIESEIDGVRDHSRTVVENYRANLFKRLSESGLENLDLDDERVLREIGIFAERSDISEELTRIDSHLGQFRNYFASDEPVGRPLDFLCQELNREFNTIGSKANDAGIAQRIVNAKTELEKIREQVQNVQ